MSGVYIVLLNLLSSLFKNYWIETYYNIVENMDEATSNKGAMSISPGGSWPGNNMRYYLGRGYHVDETRGKLVLDDVVGNLSISARIGTTGYESYGWHTVNGTITLTIDGEKAEESTWWSSRNANSSGDGPTTLSLAKANGLYAMQGASESFIKYGSIASAAYQAPSIACLFKINENSSIYANYLTASANGINFCEAHFDGQSIREVESYYADKYPHNGIEPVEV